MARSGLVGDRTVSELRNADVIEAYVDGIASWFSLSRTSVRKRLLEAHGRTLGRNVFPDEWPDLADDVASHNVAQARELDLADHIARITGLSVSTVERRLIGVHGGTKVTTVFADEWPLGDDDDDQDDDDEDDNEDDGDATRTRRQTPCPCQSGRPFAQCHGDSSGQPARGGSESTDGPSTRRGGHAAPGWGDLPDDYNRTRGSANDDATHGANARSNVGGPGAGPSAGPAVHADPELHDNERLVLQMGGLSWPVSRELIQKARSEQAKIVHPDKHPDNPTAAKLMTRVNDGCDRLLRRFAQT